MRVSLIFSFVCKNMARGKKRNGEIKVRDPLSHLCFAMLLQIRVLSTFIFVFCSSPVERNKSIITEISFLLLQI